MAAAKISELPRPTIYPRASAQSASIRGNFQFRLSKKTAAHQTGGPPPSVVKDYS
jgi:hypothetical protein